PFIRDPVGEGPNFLFNYTYAIIRAMTARALVCAGLLPALGIHHRNQYNAYCLADDIMEPYRPFGDALVMSVLRKINAGEEIELNKETKSQLLGIGVADVTLRKQTSPLMVALTHTAVSLVKCLEGERKTLEYPSFPGHAAF
ncbi:MAG: type II CRISPR-associated endonuclease Cas1, partial [Bacteroidetes bacterium]